MEKQITGTGTAFLFIIFVSSIIGLDFTPFDGFEKHSLFLKGPHPNKLSKRSAEYIRRLPDPRPLGQLKITNFNVQSDIRYRYSSTYFTSTVINTFSHASEVNFQVILPESGFISKFCMEIDGITYEAYVKEKEEAKQIYTHAKETGQSAGLVELNSRYSNLFNVNVNIHARSVVRFNLTYEELLQRKLGRYELLINISPQQVYNVEEVGIIVTIEEFEYNKLKSIEIPKFKYSQLEIEADENDNNNLDAQIQQPRINRARIQWKPSSTDIEKLKQSKEGIGKFIVRYEVENIVNATSEAGQVLVMNGYFVHFFSPPNLKSLKKHVVFVLDISGSMSGRKIEQLQEAMRRILADLKTEDYFNIITFSSGVSHWNPNIQTQPRRSRQYYFYGSPSEEIITEGAESSEPYPASRINIGKSQEFITSLYAGGGTNINDAVKEGLRIANTGSLTNPKSIGSMIIFLTDGQPTVGITNLPSIQRNIRNANEELSIPIFSLAFGIESDFSFLKRLSLQNFGFARKIYEAADAKLQLEGFYKEISSPLLKDVKFTYTNPSNDNYKVDDTTTINFNTFYHGNEIITAGKVSPTYSKGIRPGLKTSSSTKDHPNNLKLASSHSLVVEKEENTFVYFPFYNDIPCSFPVQVYGCARDKCITWKIPHIYSYRLWQWRCPPSVPITQPPTPPAPPTKEDYFLERFWAYLTIQQLLDQDFAEDKPSSSSVARQKALKLSLDYGFVTPLTSLVVVKPEEPIYIAEPVPIDDFSKQQTIGGSGTHGGINFAVGSGTSFKRRPSLALADSSNYAEESSAISSSNHKRPPGPDYDSYPGTASSSPIVYTTVRVRRKSTTPSTSKPGDVYGLNDISWLNVPPYKLKISGKSYDISSEQENDIELTEKNCFIMNGKKISGQCKHLKDCVQEEFLDDFDAYKKYFCEAEAKSTRIIYAGACCPNY